MKSSGSGGDAYTFILITEGIIAFSTWEEGGSRPSLIMFTIQASGEVVAGGRPISVARAGSKSGLSRGVSTLQRKSNKTCHRRRRMGGE